MSVVAVEPREALEWFVEFANLKLDGLKAGDKAKLLVESEEYLFPNLENLLPYVKKMIRRFFSKKEGTWAFEEHPQRGSVEYWSLLHHLRGEVRLELYGLTMPEDRNYARIEPVMFHLVRDPEKFSTKIVPLTKSLDQYVRIYLNLLLDGLSRSVLKRCPSPNCGKYFVNFSLRKKTFCSPRCMWRFNSAERRKKLKDENPKKYQEYLDKQKKLMRRKYEAQKAEGYRKLMQYRTPQKKED